MMTPRQQLLWNHAARHAWSETAMINDGHFSTTLKLFFNVD
jgi:hypothetical protein